MPTYTFSVNGKKVAVDTDGDVRLLWVLRDLLGITGPKYGCGLAVCKACTSHINGHAFSPCAVPVSQLRDDDEITTIEGLAATVGADLHPVQQAWLDHDVAQCGYCQPGQIMASVGLIEAAIAEGRTLTDADLDGLRNICRCGTYDRIRAAVLDAARVMAGHPSTGPATTTAAAPAVAPREAAVAVRSALNRAVSDVRR